MRYIFSTIALLAVAVPGLANGQGATGSSGEVAKEETDKSQNRMICKRQKSTGSRIGAKRVCMTAAQWAQIQRDERQALERGQANRPTDGG